MPSDAVSRGQRRPSGDSDDSGSSSGPNRRPMPEHWKATFKGPRIYATLLEFVFRSLCLMSFGSRNLDELWSTMGDAVAEKGERTEGSERFITYKDRLISKVSIVTVVVSCFNSYVEVNTDPNYASPLRPDCFSVRPQH